MEEDSENIISYDSSIEFDDEVFLLRPNGDSPFLGRDKLTLKDVKLVMASKGRFPGKEKRHSITVGPGYPTMIELLNESQDLLEVVEDEFVSSTLRLACFDFNGNRTGPLGEEKWTISLGDCNFELESPVNVNTDGSIIINKLRAKSLEGQNMGISVERECVLILEGSGFDEISHKLRFRISKSRHPVRAQVKTI
jgi:hypothetical protein